MNTFYVHCYSLLATVRLIDSYFQVTVYETFLSIFEFGGIFMEPFYFVCEIVQQMKM